MGITLTSKTINSTYDSLLKLSDNDSLTGAFKVITDGLGNDTGISINNAGNVTISGTLVVNTKIQTPLIQLTGVLKGPSTFYIDPLPIDTYGDATVDTGKVVILGDLEVTGTTTTVNSTVVDIADLNLTLASNATNASEANGAGITIGGASATLTYASATDDFHFNKSLNAGTFIGALTGNVTGNVTGNADTASKWATARTITIGDTGKSVDGSGNVSWSKSEIGFTLDDVTDNGATTTNDITIGDGTAANNLYVKYSDGSYSQLRGTGLFLNRTTSYIRPTTDATTTLYIGFDDGATINNPFLKVRTYAVTHEWYNDASERMTLSSAGDLNVTRDISAVSFTGNVFSINVSTTPDTIGGVKIARLHSSTQTAISSIDNLDTFILSKTDTTYGAGTKPAGADNSFGVISLQTHSGNYYTQLGLDTNQNQLWIRSANGTTTFGSWETFLNSGNYEGVFDAHYLRSDEDDTMTGNLTVVGNVQATTARLTTEGQANLTSTAHGFQIGDGTTTDQLLIDNNTMMVRNNGAGADMYLNSYGGDVFVGVQDANTTLYVTNNLYSVIHSGNIGSQSVNYATTAGSSTTATNADTVDSKHATDFTLQYVTDNGSTTSNSIKIERGSYTPSTAAYMAATSIGISNVDGNLDLLSYDDDSTVSNSIGFGRFSQVDGSIIHKFGITSWANTGSQGSNTGNKLSFNYGTSANVWGNTEIMSINTNGHLYVQNKIGVGLSTTPNATLHIKGSGWENNKVGSNILRIESTDTVGAGLSLKNTTGNYWTMYNADTSAWVGEGALNFVWSNGVDDATAPMMTLHKTGKLGIGTGAGTPSKRLHVKTTENEGIFLQGTSGGVWMDFQSSTSDLWSIGALGADGFGIYNRTDNEYALRVDNNRNFGLNISPTSTDRLLVDGSIAIETNPTNNNNSSWYSIVDSDNQVVVRDGTDVYFKKWKAADGYNAFMLYPETVGLNFDLSFKLTLSVGSTSYRHLAIAIASDGSNTTTNYDYIVFRDGSNSSLNQIRIDVAGITEQSLVGTSVPDFGDGTERHVTIQVRNNKYVIEIDGVVKHSFTASARTNARGKIGFCIYETTASNTWCKIRQFEITQYADNTHTLPQSNIANGSLEIGGTVVIDSSRDFYANTTASNSSPRYKFKDDTDTGLGYIGTNAVGLIAGGSRKFYVNSTTAYFQNLTGGVDIASGSLKMAGTTVIDSSRNIYANAATFAGAVSYGGNIYADGDIRTNDNEFQIRNSTTSDRWYSWMDTDTYTLSFHDESESTDTDLLTLSPTGDLAITGGFDVASLTTDTLTIDGASTASIDFKVASTAYASITSSSTGLSIASQPQITFATAATTALTIDTSQNATFAGNLQVDGSATITETIDAKNIGYYGTGHGILIKDYDGVVANNMRVYYDDGGKVVRFYSYHGATGDANLALYYGSDFVTITGGKINNWDSAYSFTSGFSIGDYYTTLDGRYYTETESDGKYLLNTTDTLTGNLTVTDSAQFEGTTKPIRIGDGFGSGGSATIHKYQSDLYLQYNNGNTTSTLQIGGGGTATSIRDAQNQDFYFASGGGDSYFAHDLGVGSTIPTGKFHVATNTNNDGITLSGQSDNLRFNIKNNQTTSGKRAFSMMMSGSYPALIFQALNDDYSYKRNIMAINHDGYVGFGGNINPAYTVDITGELHLTDKIRIEKSPSDTVGQGPSIYLIGGEGSSYSYLQQGVGRFTIFGFDGASWGEKMTIKHSNGNIGFGATLPLGNVNNNGMQISRGGHTMLMIGDGTNYGGVIQSSDNKKRMFMGANVYDDVSGSWSKFNAASGTAAFDAITDSTYGFARMLVEPPSGSGYPTPFVDAYYSDTTSYLKLRTATDNALYIKNNGYIGIKETDPQRPLHIDSDYPQVRLQNNRDSTYMDIGCGANYAVWNIVNPTTNLYQWRYADSAKMTMLTNGNLGINTTSPQSPLQADGAFSADYGVIRHNGSNEMIIAEYLGTSTPVPFAIRNSTSLGDTSQNFGTLHIDRAGSANGGGSNMYFRRKDNAGNWREYAGIGGVIDSNISTAYTGHLDFYVSNNGSGRLNYMRLQAGGTLQVDGDVVAYSTVVPSDERLKDNVKTIDNALDKVKSLRGVEFDWNRGKKKGVNDIGLIAQEVEKVIPQVVEERELPLMDGNEDGEKFKTVQYEKLVGVLIEAMKEQQEQIDELKRRLDGSTK